MEPLNCGILQIKTPLGGSPREHWPRSSNWHRCGFPSGRSPPTPAVRAYRRRRQKQNGSGDLKGSQNNLELLFTTENCNQAMMYVPKMCVCVYYVYAYVYIYIYIQTYTCMHMYTYTCVCVVDMGVYSCM